MLRFANHRVLRSVGDVLALITDSKRAPGNLRATGVHQLRSHGRSATAYFSCVSVTGESSRFLMEYLLNVMPQAEAA